MSRAPLAVAAALLACAAPAFTPAPARAATAAKGPWSLELVDAAGRPLPTFCHRGRTFVLGRMGERYQLRIRNGSPRRIEVVASVDGRDVLDGQPATPERRGYLVEPWGEVVIDGFRLSQAQVAAFRFSSVPRSYAAQMGDARDVGVVGAAVFTERERPAVAMDPRAEAAPGAGAPREPYDAATPPPAAAPSASARSADQRSADAARPGLGTAFGEARDSAVFEVPFERATSRPAAVLTLRYDDRAGLVAAGVDVDASVARDDDRWLREHAQPFHGGTYAQPPPGW